MKRKVISFVLAAGMMLSLAACGGSTGTTSGASTSAAAAAASSTTTTKPSGAAFKIGGTAPLTGAAAIYGNAAKNGAEIAVEEINAAGGDIQFDLRYEDDVNDPEKAINAYNTLKDWGMQISLGSVTTKPCEATSTETYSDRIFALTPSASSKAVIERKDNQSQMCFMDPNQGSASAQYISEKKLGTKIAIIWKNDDVYSKGIYQTFTEKAKELKLDIVSETTFTDATSTDFTVQLTAAKNAGADLVFLPIYYQPASVILSQAKAMSYEPTFFGVDGMDGILTMPGFDASLAEGVMLLTPFSVNSEDAATQSFVKTYTEKYGVEPNQFAADAYDGVYIVKAALEKAGCTADMSSTDICEALIQVMPTLSVDGLTGKAMTWNAEGEVSKAPLAAVIENGEYVMK